MRQLLIIAPAALALIGARQEESGAVQGEPAELPALVDAEPFAVPIVDAGRVTGTLAVDLMFQAADGNSDALGDAMPQLRAATRDALAEHARLHASPWQAVDAEELVRALDVAGKRVSPALQRVLITELRTHRA